MRARTPGGRRQFGAFYGRERHVHAQVAPRIAIQARRELAPQVLVADVIADGRFPNLVHRAATLDIALDRDALDLAHRGRGAAIFPVHLVAHHAAHDGAGGGATIAAAARIAELVAHHAADHRAQHGGGADGGTGVAAGDAALFIAALHLVPAFLAGNGDALVDRMDVEDARAVVERFHAERGRGSRSEGRNGKSKLHHVAIFLWLWALPPLNARPLAPVDPV